MPLFTSPEGPHFLSITAGCPVDGPVNLSLSVLDAKSRFVPDHRLLVEISGNCRLVGQVVTDFVCGWESGAPTPYFVDGVARLLRANRVTYHRS